MSGQSPYFCVTPLEFEYETLEPLYLAAGKATNILRGALGLTLQEIVCEPACLGSMSCQRPSDSPPCLYQQLFLGETGGPRPSGYQDAPRPFVLRWHDWGEARMAPGTRFRTSLHFFDGRPEVLSLLLRAYEQLPAAGLGPGRAKCRLLAIRGEGSLLWTPEQKELTAQPSVLRLPLGPVADAPERVVVRFLTPTEVKHEGKILIRPMFRPLFQRLRERLAFLVSHYGMDGTEFAGLGAKAEAEIAAAGEVRLVREALRPVEGQRFSTRTGQTHPLSGLVGEAEFSGDFRLLWNWLKASEWSGVGRQTVWGKGAVRWDACD